MSTAAVIGIGYLTASGLAVLAWARLGRTRRPSEEQRAAAARQRVGIIPDPRWGTNAAARSACERIWDLPEYDPDLNTGCARLWQAIRDEQQKGDRS